MPAERPLPESAADAIGECDRAKSAAALSCRLVQLPEVLPLGRPQQLAVIQDQVAFRQHIDDNRQFSRLYGHIFPRILRGHVLT
jgi:hypothetical protein